MIEIYIQPAVVKQKGKPDRTLQVRMPDKPLTFLPAFGAKVNFTTYWLRRINDGSVVVISKKDLAKAEAAENKKNAAEEKKAETTQSQG